MHHLGVVTEQLTHDDPRVAVARRQARQRRDARRDARRDGGAARVAQPIATAPASPATPTAWWTPAKGKHVGPKHLRSWTWRGVLAHHH
jgi:hypothetical protein